jgi:glycosyltransferase involved in cell wall biosynthesis
MNMHIFILCHNESVLLPQAIVHYRNYFPQSTITIVDNESTDGSPEIARLLGCQVMSVSGNIAELASNIKNNCWSNIKDWIIVVDIDEWLCITEQELEHEVQNGTTILQTRILEMIGESKNEHLTDINLHRIPRYINNNYLNKPVCFNSNYVSFNQGNPDGRVKYSNGCYVIKSMVFLGLPYYTKRMNERYERVHANEYRQALINSQILNLR